MPRSKAPAGTLGLSTRTNRAPTFEPAGRSRGLGTGYLITWATFHRAVSSLLPATSVQLGLGYSRYLLYICVVK